MRIFGPLEVSRILNFPHLDGCLLCRHALSLYERQLLIFTAFQLYVILLTIVLQSV